MKDISVNIHNVKVFQVSNTNSLSGSFTRDIVIKNTSGVQMQFTLFSDNKQDLEIKFAEWNE